MKNILKITTSIFIVGSLFLFGTPKLAFACDSGKGERACNCNGSYRCIQGWESCSCDAPKPPAATQAPASNTSQSTPAPTAAPTTAPSSNVTGKCESWCGSCGYTFVACGSYCPTAGQCGDAGSTDLRTTNGGKPNENQTTNTDPIVNGVHVSQPGTIAGGTPTPTPAPTNKTTSSDTSGGLAFCTGLGMKSIINCTCTDWIRDGKDSKGNLCKDLPGVTPTPSTKCMSYQQCNAYADATCTENPKGSGCYKPIAITDTPTPSGKPGGCNASCAWFLPNQCASGLSCTGYGVCRNDKCLSTNSCTCDPTPSITTPPTPGACNQICSSTTPCGSGFSCGGDSRCHNSSCKYGQDNSCNCLPSTTTVTCPTSPTSCIKGWHLTSLNFVANPNCDIKTCTPDITVTATAAPLAPTCITPTHCSTGLVETPYTDSKNCAQYKCSSGATPTPSICPAIIVPVCNLSTQTQKYKTVGGCIVGDGCADIPCNANTKPVSDGSATWTCSGGSWVAQYNPGGGQPKTPTQPPSQAPSQQPTQTSSASTSNQCNRVGDVYTGPGKKLVCNSSHQWVEPYGPKPTEAPTGTPTPTTVAPTATVAPTNTPDYGGGGANSGNSGFSGTSVAPTQTPSPTATNGFTNPNSRINTSLRPTQGSNPTKAPNQAPSGTVQPTNTITPTKVPTSAPALPTAGAALPPPGTATAPTPR